MVLFSILRNLARALGAVLLIGGEEVLLEEIKSVDALEQVLEEHGESGALLFKHSTACPISLGAHREVQRYWVSVTDAEQPQGDSAHPPLYLVKVIESRPVSNDIADRFGVQHQSPQMLFIRDGQSVWDASHGAIIAETIKKAVAEHM